MVAFGSEKNKFYDHSCVNVLELLNGLIRRTNKEIIGPESFEIFLFVKKAAEKVCTFFGVLTVN